MEDTLPAALSLIDNVLSGHKPRLWAEGPGERMTLAELQYVVAVAQERHFDRAAARSDRDSRTVYPSRSGSITERTCTPMLLELEENLTQNLAGMLKSGKLDVIMIALPFEESGILTTALYDEPFQVVVPVGHPWQKKKSLDSRQLGTEKVLLPHAGHCFRQQVLEVCPELSRSDAESWQGNSLETIRQMVVSGFGITVMPCSALTAKYHHKRLIAIKLAQPVPGRRIGLAWRRGYTRPQVVEVLQETVRALQIPGLSMVTG